MSRCAFLTLIVGLCMSSSLAAADHRDRFERRIFTGGGTQLPYRLLKPKNYDPSQKYPLVVFLHGAGERGNDNHKQLVHGMNDFASDEIMDKYPAFVMAPQCPEGQWWAPFNQATKSAAGGDQPAPALAAVLEAIPALQKEFSIDAQRIYITGLSMGGYGTWAAISRRPELFAAAAPICGGGDPASAATIKHIPIWAFHGADDNVVPAAQSRQMIEALKAAGAQPKYTEYSGVGHDSWTETYRNPELYAWLFAQRRP